MYKPNRPRQLFFDGNSLFARANANLANALASPLYLYSQLTSPKPPMFAYPLSGASIAELITAFPTKIAPYIRAGDILLMNEVTNELGDSQNPTTTYNYLLQYRDLVHALGAKIVVMTMPARVITYANMEIDRLSLNANILANASQFDGVADSGGQTEFNSIAATLNTTYYNADQLHFTTAGYQLYVTPAISIVQTLLNT